MAKEISINLAQRLLDSFNYPVSAKSENYDLGKLKGGFISNNNYFSKPHCSGAYFNGNDQEFYIAWSGFDDLDDTNIVTGDCYAFQSTEIANNYNDCIRIIKNHLKDIINSYN